MTLRMAHSMAVLRVSEEFGHLGGWQLLCVQVTPQYTICIQLRHSAISAGDIQEIKALRHIESLWNAHPNAGALKNHVSTRFKKLLQEIFKKLHQIALDYVRMIPTPRVSLPLLGAEGTELLEKLMVSKIQPALGNSYR